MAFDLEKIEKLMQMITEHGITELELTEGDSFLKLGKNNLNFQPLSPSILMQETQAMNNLQLPDASTVNFETSTPNPDQGKIMKSPIVGTFYRASGPGKEPFVEVGTKVNKGDILCIIEAMKMLNQIEAEFSGVVKQIYVDNANPVEFNQALFLIE